MNNNIIDKTFLFNGLNLNPIPLEMSQSMTTTKWLMGMEHKLSSIIDDVNKWYDEILIDLEGNGALYEKLNEQFISSFATEIGTIQSSLSNVVNGLNDVVYIKPSAVLNLSSNVNNLYGVPLNAVIISSNITGSLPLTKTEFYVNDVLHSTITGDNRQPYITLNNISNDTAIYIKMYDGKSVIQSGTINIKFFYPAYIGVVDSSITTPSEINVKSLNAWNVAKTNLGNNFTCDDKKVVYAIPKSWGALSSIRDFSKLNLGYSFFRQTLNITANDGNVIEYYVYISADSVTLDNYKIDFNLTEGVV